MPSQRRRAAFSGTTASGSGSIAEASTGTCAMVLGPCISRSLPSVGELSAAVAVSSSFHYLAAVQRRVATEAELHRMRHPQTPARAPTAPWRCVRPRTAHSTGGGQIEGNLDKKIRSCFADRPGNSAQKTGGGLRKQGSTTSQRGGAAGRTIARLGSQVKTGQVIDSEDRPELPNRQRLKIPSEGRGDLASVPSTIPCRRFKFCRDL